MVTDELLNHFSTLSPFELLLRIIAAAEPNNDKKRKHGKPNTCLEKVQEQDKKWSWNGFCANVEA